MKALGSDRVTFKTNMPELWSNPLPCKGWGKSLPLTQHISPHQSQHKIQLGNLICQSMYNKTFVVFSPVQGKSENPWRQKQGMQTRLQLPLIARLHRLLNLLQTDTQAVLADSKHSPDSGSSWPCPLILEYAMHAMLLFFLQTLLVHPFFCGIQLYWFHVLPWVQPRKQCSLHHRWILKTSLFLTVIP